MEKLAPFEAEHSRAATSVVIYRRTGCHAGEGTDPQSGMVGEAHVQLERPQELLPGRTGFPPAVSTRDNVPSTMIIGPDGPPTGVLVEAYGDQIAHPAIASQMV